MMVKIRRGRENLSSCISYCSDYLLTSCELKHKSFPHFNFSSLLNETLISFHQSNFFFFPLISYASEGALSSLDEFVEQGVDRGCGNFKIKFFLKNLIFKKIFKNNFNSLGSTFVRKGRRLSDLFHSRFVLQFFMNLFSFFLKSFFPSFMCVMYTYI